MRRRSAVGPVEAEKQAEPGLAVPGVVQVIGQVGKRTTEALGLRLGEPEVAQHQHGLGGRGGDLVGDGLKHDGGLGGSLVADETELASRALVVLLGTATHLPGLRHPHQAGLAQHLQVMSKLLLYCCVNM